MTYAIIEAGGKQIKVEPGRFYDVDRIAVDQDSQITLDKVLLVSHDGETSVGQPHVKDASVQATVLSHLRGRKIIVYKMLPKKKTRKKRGYRHELTRLMIDSIQLNGSVFAAEGEAAATVKDAIADAAKMVAKSTKKTEVAPVDETVTPESEEATTATAAEPEVEAPEAKPETPEVAAEPAAEAPEAVESEPEVAAKPAAEEKAQNSKKAKKKEDKKED